MTQIPRLAKPWDTARRDCQKGARIPGCPETDRQAQESECGGRTFLSARKPSSSRTGISAALEDAKNAAAALSDPKSKAKAHHAAYRAALELKKKDIALAELRLAAAADPRYALWDAHKHDLREILGEGAFGVAMLCSW